ncbi:pilin [Enterovibrio paralichthyis]|uniref:pilin n=1 Tax=Enterovibrio paralichthyis TaxID=2853805 RepID=UPI001C4735B0|nr:prepilin-type N-terminal cleavage/methylation domain-containing protein [Enterovibrio paralichthyis]MBV7297902.1 prepilin-type N-terminal cleavage/methylation domain-containing protein [Enterovibrio paralichthyis]
MKKQKGFSLIELLIVVGIIGALTAIAVPAYSEYKRQSDVAAAVASVKTLLTKAEEHLSEKTTNTLKTFITAADTAGGLNAPATGYAVGELGVITAGTDNSLVFTMGKNVSFPDETITYTRTNVVWGCAMSAGITGVEVKGCN